MNNKQLGLAAMVIAALGLAIAVILMKIIPTMTGIPPQHVAIWRFTIAAPPLWLVNRHRRTTKPMVSEHRWWFYGLGLIFSLASFSAIFALQRLSSSIYVILIYIYPSLVVLYALLTGGAVPSLYWLGLPLTLLGLFLTSFEFGSKLVIDPVGFGITMVNALALAAYMILSGKVFSAIKNRLIGSSRVLTGAMFLGLLMLPLLGISTPETIRGWALLLTFGVFGTLMPIIAINLSLGLLGAARGSLMITLQPVLTVLLAMIFLNESLSLQQWMGGGLVILAVVLLQRSPDRAAMQISDQPEYLIVQSDQSGPRDNSK